MALSGYLQTRKSNTITPTPDNSVKGDLTKTQWMTQENIFTECREKRGSVGKRWGLFC